MFKIELDLKSGDGFELSIMRDSVNKMFIECGNAKLMDNREVKVLIEKHFKNT